MGELLLGALIETVFDRLASDLIVPFARRLWGIRGMHKLLEKWRRELEYIKAVIDDAEDKQLTKKPVKLWLEDLRDLAYDLDDVLDEICTRALIHKSAEESSGGGKLCGLIPSCKDCTTGADVFKKKMKATSMIEDISKRLEEIFKTGNELGLNQNVLQPATAPMDRQPTTSLMEPRVFGREKDKEAVSKLMMESYEGLCVIPIVGMGGVGKTTLAQLIYNDEVIAAGFDLKVWVCVSAEFDVFSITKTIFCSATKRSAESMDLNSLQEEIRQIFSKTKFLLILDDVWNKEYLKWDTLIRPLHSGAFGSRVLVTTRDDQIAAMVGGDHHKESDCVHRVNKLMDNDCLSLLAQHALGKENFNEHPDFKRCGESLTRKCNGLPLAAKALGGLLRTKKSVWEWEGVLNSKIWNLQDNILPVLRLSYHHLPSHLKHLFAYCSIFPKDYEFDKYELVLVWMGEGFLTQPKDGTKTKEQLGFEYFDELRSRSFFQRLNNDASHFVMHDLINDLAQFVAGEICYKQDEKLETNDEYRIPQKARHASFLCHEYEVFKKFKGFPQAKGLRTFIPMIVKGKYLFGSYLSNKILSELLPELHTLRVLSLSGYAIRGLPDSICALIHIRYLNLSYTDIVSLPNSLGDLYNLETLSIRNCHHITNLPSTMGDLANLRHLDNSNTYQLTDLPVEIGRLGNLQSLPKIPLSKRGGLGLKQLRNLKLLQRTVSISELQNVTDIEQAKEACMRQKHIEELQLSWESDGNNSSHNGRLEEEVLNELEPHENLGSLIIEYYRGSSFPSWISNTSFCKLSSISVIGCFECAYLPTLGQLPELKHLWVGSMMKVKSIGMEFYGSGDGVPFPKLETLIFSDMPVLEKWASSSDRENAHVQFPHLYHLEMSKCGKLIDVFPQRFPALRKLNLDGCSNVLLESFSGLDSLNHLKIEEITGLSHLPRELSRSLAALEVLECSNCTELLSVWPDEIQHLNKLKRLVIANCLQFVSFGKGDQQLPYNLEVLELSGCANLASLPNDLKQLGSLKELIIRNCVKLVSFPENGIPPMLKGLSIWRCEALESLQIDVSNLERMDIRDCQSLKTWAMGNFPTALKELSIDDCDQLEPISEEMFPQSSGAFLLENLTLYRWLNCSSLLQRLHGFALLVELRLSRCDVLRRFPELPVSLRSLHIVDCKNLECLPSSIQNMNSLQELKLHYCKGLDNFPRCNLPPNLASLEVVLCRGLKPLTEWGLHRLTSLKELSISGGYQELVLLGDDDRLFPPSLVELRIEDFPKLTSMGKVLDSLTLLRHLAIRDCPKLDDLPSEVLLENLWHLGINGCPLLTQRCRKEFWPKIAGIPYVKLEGWGSSTASILNCIML